MTASRTTGDEVAVSTGHGDVAFRSRESRMPGPGEVAGRTVASVVSPGTELALIGHGLDGWNGELGYAAVFVVDAVGDGVPGFAVGDVVLGMGPHARRQVRPVHELVAVPAEMDPRLAPFARLAHVGAATLATTTARPPDVVGVVGLGIVGQLAVRSAQVLGFEVVGSDADPARRALLPPGARGRERLDPESVDLVLECTGHEARVSEAVGALRSGGELSLVGVPWRPREHEALHPVLSAVFHRYLTVRSGWEWQVPWRADAGPTIPGLLSAALAALGDGSMGVAGLAATIPPDELPAAYGRLQRRRAPALTYLVDWS